MANKFRIGVYGVLMQNNALLVSDELVMNKAITKLPGGGLEFGEGTLEGLEREFYEELNIKVEVLDHFYTTDFYVPSAFDPSFQVISIYYLVSTPNTIDHHISKEAHEYKKTGKKQSFRWIPIAQLKESDLTLVIDRKVAAMIAEKFAV